MKNYRIRRFRFLTAAAALCGIAMTSSLTVSAENPRPDNVERTIVFNPGDYDSKFYRIPALAVLNSGELIAVADKRMETIKDLPGNIDLVARISGDNGATWGPYNTIVAHDRDGGYGDPAIVVDRNTGDVLVICSHGSGFWEGGPAEITVIRSTDNGRTWSEPVNINPSILTTSPDGPQPIRNVGGVFASSGAALQLDNGRLMFVLVVRHKDKGEFSNYAVFSDDGGHTWQVADNPGCLDGDEAKVAQVADGTLIMSVRSRNKLGRRSFSWSSDRGKTWSPSRKIEALPDPACNGDFICFNAGSSELLLQSLPAAMKLRPGLEAVPGKVVEREDIGIYGSSDGGETWPYFRRITWGPAAYSSMARLPDGSLGVLTEEGVENCGDDHTGGYRIWFLRMPISEITGEE